MNTEEPSIQIKNIGVIILKNTFMLFKEKLEPIFTGTSYTSLLE